MIIINKYLSSKYFQLEVNTESKIGRVALDTSHILSITPSSVIVYHPEVFHSIDEIVSSSSLHFEFPPSSYTLHVDETHDFKIILTLIDTFLVSIGINPEHYL